METLGFGQPCVALDLETDAAVMASISGVYRQQTVQLILFIISQTDRQNIHDIIAVNVTL